MARDWSSYFWPGSDVLRNKPGITDARRLEEAEYDITELRMQQLLANPSLVTATDPVRRLQQVHKHLFGDVYDWAGELRDVEIRKGQTLFADPTRTASVFRHGTSQLKPQTWTNRRRAVNGLANGFGWLNYAHPFREGNGRATRTYLRLALREHGFDLDMASVDRRSWTVASIMSSPRENRLGTVTVSPGVVKDLLDKAVQPAKSIQQVDERLIRQVVDGYAVKPARQRTGTFPVQAAQSISFEPER